MVYKASSSCSDYQMSSSKSTAMSPSSRNAVLFALIAIGVIISDVNAKPPSRIKNGEESPPGNYTWVVGILVNEHDTITVCGGAIISPRYILTAGHCVYNHTHTFYVRSGSIHANSKDVLVSRVFGYVLHEDYVHLIPGVQDIKNDIAILVLEQDLPIDEKRSIASLPTEQVTNQTALFAGWGSVNEDPVFVPTTLQTTVVQVDVEQCLSRMPQFICGYQPNGYILDGDSGSPLISGGVIVGLASNGPGVVRVSDVFTNVYHYVPWIIRTVLLSHNS